MSKPRKPPMILAIFTNVHGELIVEIIILECNNGNAMSHCHILMGIFTF